MSLFSNSSSSGLFSSSSNNNNNLFSGSSNNKNNLFSSSTNNNNLFSSSTNNNSNLFSSSSNQNSLLSNSSGLFSQSLFSQPQDKIHDNIQPNLYQCDAGHVLLKINDEGENYPCSSCERLYSLMENPPMGCMLCFFFLCRECFQKRGQSKTLLKNQGPVRKTYTKEGVKEAAEDDEVQENNEENQRPVRKTYTKEEVKEAAEDNEVQENNQENQCSGCREVKKTHLLLPCGHVCACNKCSTDLVDTKGECPECKRQVENRVKVF